MVGVSKQIIPREYTCGFGETLAVPAGTLSDQDVFGSQGDFHMITTYNYNLQGSKTLKLNHDVGTLGWLFIHGAASTHKR